MTGAVEQFVFDGCELRAELVDGDPWFVAADIARVLGYRMASDMTRRLAPEDRGTRSVRTPSGVQSMAVISLPGLMVAVLGSQVPGARAFQHWVTHEVLPKLLITGTYTVQPERLSRRQMAERLLDAEIRAEQGEQFKRAIEAGDGLPIRAFHKKYFSAVPEHAFFDHLYSKGYLINQREKGSYRADGTRRDGSQHRHPGHRGKPWLYLHSSLDNRGGRRENSRVRPGAAEIEFRDLLAAQGLPANETSGGLFAIDGGQAS